MTTTRNLKYYTGDLFASTMPALAHGVNLEGVMGSGIAPLFRKNYPTIYDPYVTACVDGSLKPGGVLPIKVDAGKYVFNIATQERQGANAQIRFVRAGILKALEYASQNRISGIAFPRIGAGVGGLDWDSINTIFVNATRLYPEITVEVWTLASEPNSSPIPSPSIFKNLKRH